MGVDEELIQPVNTQIYAFDGAGVKLIGTVTLPVYTMDRILMMKFFLVHTQSTVNTTWVKSGAL